MPSQTLKQRKDGRYLVRYNGKPFYGYTQKEALAKREEYKRQEALGLLPKEDAVLFRDYAPKWLKTYKCNLSPTATRMYASYTKKAIAQFGDMEIAKITRTDIVTGYNTLIGTSGSNCKKFSMVVKAIMEAAFADGLVNRNPCLGVKPPRGPEGTHRCLEEWEKGLIVQALESGHRFALAAVVMLYTGMRRGEVTAMNIDEDVDFENDVVHVRKAVQFDGSVSHLSTTKTEAGIRTIPLLPQLKAVLQDRHGMVLPGEREGGFVSETVMKELIKEL